MELHKSKYSDGKTDGRNARLENKAYRSFRNSRDDRGSRSDSRDESTTVTCSDCGTECTVPFVPRTSKPVYCSDCFRQNKPQDSGNDRYSNDRGSRYSNDRGSRYSNDRGSRSDSRDESTTVTCSDCGTECTVPFVPRTSKPVYCSDCFRQNKPQDSGNDRYSNDRGSRYSNDGGSRYSNDGGSRYSNDGGSRYSNDGGSRYSNDGGSRSDSRDESTTVTCSDCGTECTVPFVPRTSKPVYCSDCFRQNKPRDSGNDRYSGDDRGSRYSRDDRGSRNDSRDESTTVTCSDCGTECTVPFVPRTSKPVYCSDCFRQNKPQDSGNDRYSNDRGSRSSSRRESSRNNPRPSKPRNDKFLRKQESFFSGGSDKFVETIKEKLYEILGGKICSNCGFKDERALGICPVSENVTSDNSGRGGDAASWGKYVSEPDLAREELKVFCLNCNQIREPTPKRTEDRSRPKSKKSKYFPR